LPTLSKRLFRKKTTKTKRDHLRGLEENDRTLKLSIYQQLKKDRE
jgi:hypothetical protein